MAFRHSTRGQFEVCTWMPASKGPPSSHVNGENPATLPLSCWVVQDTLYAYLNWNRNLLSGKDVNIILSALGAKVFADIAEKTAGQSKSSCQMQQKDEELSGIAAVNPVNQSGSIVTYNESGIPSPTTLYHRLVRKRQFDIKEACHPDPRPMASYHSRPTTFS